MGQYALTTAEVAQGGVEQDHVHPIVADSAVFLLCKVNRELAYRFSRERT